MSKIDRIKNLALSLRERAERVVGRALGDEDMPSKEQVQELREHLQTLGVKVVRTTGRVLGDEDMALAAQIAQVKGHLEVGATKVCAVWRKGALRGGSK